MEEKLEVNIVQVRRIHVPGIMRIERNSFPSPWPEQAIWGELGNPFSNFFVAQPKKLEKDKYIPFVLGYIIFWTIADSDMQILSIAVHEDYRRRGIGQKLLEHSIKVGKEKKMEFIFLEVRESNVNAISFYKKNGFMKAGVRKGYYSDNGENALVMGLLLN